MPRTFIISEAGSCHDGSLQKAVGLIEVAKAGGADACKFQYWSKASRLAERRRAPAYLPIYEKYAIPADWLPALRAECDVRDIEFMCTAYLPEDVYTVAQHVRRFKIASFEADDAAFVNQHREYDKPIIVSMGMGAVPPYDVTRLHCVSAYPTPLDEANLAAIRRVAVAGFSDHTRNILTGAFAVCVGARILEVHIRDYVTATDNPDFATALDPAEFRAYVEHVRLAERMLGSGNPEAQPSEAAMSQYKVRHAS